jgi:hypothetical protein
MENTQKRKISKKSRKKSEAKKMESENREIKDIEWEKTKTRKQSNIHIRNEVFLLIDLFQQYLFRNETQSVTNLLNDSTPLIVMVFGFLYLIMKISEIVCYRSSDATTAWQWSRK